MRDYRDQRDLDGSTMIEEVREYGGELAAYNVVAAYPDMPSAKSAVDALQQAGVEAANIALLGEAVAEARSRPTLHETFHTDERSVSDIARRANAGAIAGAIIGLFAGVVLGIVTGLTLWIALMWGVLMFGGFGAILAALWSLNTSSELAETTYHSVTPGHVLVGVRSAERSLVERSAGVLERKEPMALHRFDGAGRSFA